VARQKLLGDLLLLLKKAVLVFMDIFLVNAAAILALMLRYDFNVPTDQFYNYYNTALIMTGVMLCVFYVFHLYKSIWLYASVGELLYVFFACLTGATALFVLFRLVLDIGFPRSFYLIFMLLSVAFIGGVRFAFRLLRRARHIYRKKRGDFSRVMIIGGGVAGSLTIKEIYNNPQLKKIPVAVIDDDPAKYKKSLNGVPVLGSTADIVKVAQERKIDEIVIAIPSAGRTEMKRIISLCNQTKCKVKTLPGIYDLIDGKIDIKKIRDVEISDLLGRSAVRTDLEEVSGYLKGETVLVTGGGGSIGSELCRQVARFSPNKIIILDNYENSAYDIQQELLSLHNNDPAVDIVIASVRDRDRIERIFEQYRPAVVFHAAAHKHVPLMEASPDEAVKNNVFGTMNVAECAHKYGAKRFILISTDKAVNPTSVMGATKRIAEMIIQSLDRVSDTHFTAVRFGNVLGSNGSVIPLFKKQIENGGPVTVTHPDIVRYFMTIPEAVQLVIQAGAMANGGEIFVLDMGSPVRIVDLAEDLIRLSGLEPGVDIDIVFTGLRPGEKLYEELLLAEEGLKSTAHPKIFFGQPIVQDPVKLFRFLDELKVIAQKGDADRIHAFLKSIVPEYHDEVASTISPGMEQSSRVERPLREKLVKRTGGQGVKA
jgi:FlaA1/EpsC-like NDP-sugar epimerase